MHMNIYLAYTFDNQNGYRYLDTLNFIIMTQQRPIQLTL